MKLNYICFAPNVPIKCKQNLEQIHCVISVNSTCEVPLIVQDGQWKLSARFKK